LDGLVPGQGPNHLQTPNSAKASLQWTLFTIMPASSQATVTATGRKLDLAARGISGTRAGDAACIGHIGTYRDLSEFRVVSTSIRNAFSEVIYEKNSSEKQKSSRFTIRIKFSFLYILHMQVQRNRNVYYRAFLEYESVQYQYSKS
jgi:hypothetical protein